MALLSLSLPIRQRFLNFPIREDAPRVTLRLMAGERVLREFSAGLAVGEPADWWAFYDVSEFRGQTIQVVCSDELPGAQAAWLAEAIQPSDAPLAADDLYQETYRPQLHFTSKRGWNNDPNGLVFDRGEWHLFYQHNPFGTQWGNMHWGHAVSTDLIHWTELPEALYQKSLQDMAFSGCGFVDEHNTAGWQTGPEAPLVVAFTSTGRGECLAFSQDRGRRLTEYAGNPILAHKGRDPKILWYESGRHWVMIVYEEPPESRSPEENGYAIYTSSDLKTWQRQSFLAGWYECPELFELAVMGSPEIRKWVVYGCRKGQYPSAYTVGRFDGKVFTPEMPPAPAHAGPCFYAAQLFSGTPDNRKIMLGWLSGAKYPGMPFSQGLSVPLELSLHAAQKPAEPYRLCFQPVAELDRLHGAPFEARGLNLSQLNECIAGFQAGERLDIRLTLESAAPLRLQLGDVLLEWDPRSGQIDFAGSRATLAEPPQTLRLRLLVDRSLSEVFIQEGRLAFAAATLFPAGKRELRWEGALESADLQIWSMDSIWGT